MATQSRWSQRLSSRSLFKNLKFDEHMATISKATNLATKWHYRSSEQMAFTKRNPFCSRFDFRTYKCLSYFTGPLSLLVCRGEVWNTSTGKEAGLKLVLNDWRRRSQFLHADLFQLLTHSCLGWLMGCFIGALQIGKVRGTWHSNLISFICSPFFSMLIAYSCRLTSGISCIGSRRSKLLLFAIVNFCSYRIWAQEESHCLPNGDAACPLQSD